MADIYVLIRVYCGKWRKEKDAVTINPTFDESGYYSIFERAIASVKANKDSYCDGNVIIIINDDTLLNDNFNSHEQKVKNLLSDNGFGDFLGNLYYFKSNGVGSAYATYLIRKHFTEIALHEQDIAITLDQDDTLHPKAVKSIAARMPENGITISGFKIKDHKNLDITNDGGRLHNWVVLKNRFTQSKRRLFSKYQKKSFLENPPLPSYKVPKYLALKRRKRKEKRSLSRAKSSWRSDFEYASTLGWTKSYTKAVMDLYIHDLTTFLNNNRCGVESYFREHKAYEDFLDFYVLLYAHVKVGWVASKTHTYYKQEDSITSNPNLEDFLNHRTASLLTLIDLTYDKQSVLREDSEYHLLRFLTIKLIQIETILKKYRHEFMNEGKDALGAFTIHTHEGFFINKLCRLALGENRGKKDKDLFRFEKTSRSGQTASNFSQLFSHANEIKEYGLHLKNSDLRYVIRECVDAESRMGHVKYDFNSNDENLDKRYDKKSTPAQHRYKVTRLSIYLLGAFSLGLLVVYFWPCINKCWTWVPPKIIDRIQLVDVLIPLLVAILTFSLNELSKLKILAIEEDNQKKLYYSEFEDLIRHLEANFKVMAELRHDITDGKTPADIHFENLKWPITSCLFSDEMSKIIGRDKVDDFARLKVNLRNINNSAEWLSKVFGNKSLSKAHQQECLDWEMTRYFGYLLNFYYMKENNFSFPSLWQLDEFIEASAQKNKLSSLFIYERNPGKRAYITTKYIERYLNDRREKRCVILQ